MENNQLAILRAPVLFIDGPPSIEGRYREVVNHPINLCNVLSFARGKYAWYPDNEGVPCIKFYMLNAKEPLEWIFPNKDARDKKYDEILGIK